MVRTLTKLPPPLSLPSVQWADLRPLVFDVESSATDTRHALQPWRAARGETWLTLGITAELRAGKLVVETEAMPDVEYLRRLLTQCITEDRTLVGWNVVYDCMWCHALGLGELANQIRWLDGMLLWRHVDIEPEYEKDRAHKRSYRLEHAVATFLPGRETYKDDVDYHDPSPEAREKLRVYGRRDGAYTYVIAKMLFDQLADQPYRLRAALSEAACIPLVAEATVHGLPVDTVATRELGAWLTTIADQMLAVLEPHGVTEKVIRSHVQLAKVLYDDWKLPVLKENVGKKTGKISRATDKDVLHELALIDSRVKHLRTYRGALGNRKKFAETLLDSVTYNEDGCTHPEGRVFGTYTSRLTYSSSQGKGKQAVQTGFAIHQTKREKTFRRSIMAPPGYALVEFDAAGQEFRWMAIASNDDVMLHLCEPGQDPHAYMGSRIVGIDYHEMMIRKHNDADKEAKDGRQMGKVGNLSLQYRTSARTLRTRARVDWGIDMAEDMAKYIHATYQKTYPKVPKYWERQIAQAKRDGYVETFAGRRVQLRGDWKGEFGWSMGSTAINYRIQGTGGDQKYLALEMIRPILIEAKARFAWDMHDGLYNFIPLDVVDTVVPRLHDTLNNLPYASAWGFTPPIPMTWDCKAGYTWGTLKEIPYGACVSETLHHR